MLPIYMPFTHISESTAGYIHTILGPIVLYQPGGLNVPSELAFLADKGVIQILNPVDIEDNDSLSTLKRDYQAWADLNSNGAGIDAGAYRAGSDTAPFWDENSSAQIRTELNKLRRGESTINQMDPILTARLFLALAQDHDAQTISLATDLEVAAGMEKRLMQDLKAEESEELDLSLIQRPDRKDLGAYLTRKRIESWSTLFLTGKSSADIFVTNSRSVLEHLCETSEDLVLIGDSDRLGETDERWENISQQSEGLIAYCKELTQNSDPLALLKQRPHPAIDTGGAQRKKCYCSLYIAPGTPPETFWQRYAEGGSIKKGYREESPDILNTLIFYFEFD